MVVVLKCTEFVSLTHHFHPLQLHGKPILWSHIQSLVSSERGNMGFVKTWKLKNAHVSLTPFTRMRVNLAVQVRDLKCPRFLS